MIEESDERPDPGLDDERRRYYRLTALGQRAVRAEALRYAEMAELARRKRLIGKPAHAAHAGGLS
jgi:DNA-binding MarR family transcriptional regulator